MPRKIISIVLLLLLVVNSAIMLCYYWGEVEVNRMKIHNYIITQNNINPDLVSVFYESENNFILVDEHEISFNGKMYDIIKSEIVNGKTVYTAISDSREDEIVSFIERLVKHVTTNNNRASQKGTNYEIVKYVSTVQTQLSGNRIFDGINDELIPGKDMFLYQSPSIGILCPPPQSVV